MKESIEITEKEIRSVISSRADINPNVADKILNDAYERIKEGVDELVRNAIDEALENISMNKGDLVVGMWVKHQSKIWEVLSVGVNAKIAIMGKDSSNPDNYLIISKSASLPVVYDPRKTSEDSPKEI